MKKNYEKILDKNKLYAISGNEVIMISLFGGTVETVRENGWALYKGNKPPMDLIKNLTEEEALKLILKKYKDICDSMNWDYELHHIDDINTSNELNHLMDVIYNKKLSAIDYKSYKELYSLCLEKVKTYSGNSTCNNVDNEILLRLANLSSRKILDNGDAYATKNSNNSFYFVQNFKELEIGTKVICRKDCEQYQIKKDEILTVLHFEDFKQYVILSKNLKIFSVSFVEYFKIINDEEKTMLDMGECVEYVEVLAKKHSLNKWQQHVIFLSLYYEFVIMESIKDACIEIKKFNTEYELFESDFVHKDYSMQPYSSMLINKISLASQV